MPTSETQFTLRLVSAHYDHDDEAFDDACKDLEQHYWDNGEWQLSEYVLAQRVPATAWVPMGKEVEGEYEYHESRG